MTTEKEFMRKRSLRKYVAVALSLALLIFAAGAAASSKKNWDGSSVCVNHQTRALTAPTEVGCPKGSTSKRLSTLMQSGPAGEDGSTIHSGARNPSDKDGNVGDYFFNKTTRVLFGPLTGEGWGGGVSLSGSFASSGGGSQGPSGPQGPQGQAGTDANGLSISLNQLAERRWWEDPSLPLTITGVDSPFKMEFDGAKIWFLNSDFNKLYNFDPATRVVSDPIPICRESDCTAIGWAHMTFGAGFIWVFVDETSEVLKVNVANSSVETIDWPTNITPLHDGRLTYDFEFFGDKIWTSFIELQSDDGGMTLSSVSQLTVTDVAGDGTVAAPVYLQTNGIAMSSMTFDGSHLWGRVDYYDDVYAEGIAAFDENGLQQLLRFDDDVNGIGKVFSDGQFLYFDAEYDINDDENFSVVRLKGRVSDLLAYTDSQKTPTKLFLWDLINDAVLIPQLGAYGDLGVFDGQNFYEIYRSGIDPTFFVDETSPDYWILAEMGKSSPPGFSGYEVLGNDVPRDIVFDGTDLWISLGLKNEIVRYSR
jgi:hypothetical protein